LRAASEKLPAREDRVMGVGWQVLGDECRVMGAVSLVQLQIGDCRLSLARLNAAEPQANHPDAL
jgi:hypothetical protein